MWHGADIWQTFFPPLCDPCTLQLLDHTGWRAGTEMALICDIPELPSPAAEAQRKDPKSLSLNNWPINLWVPPALAKASAKMPHFPPVSCPCLVFFHSLRSGGLFSLSENPPTHPHLDFNKSQTFVSSGFFFQCRHFWRVVNSTHFSLQS